MVTATPFSPSFPGRGPASRAQPPEPRGTRQTRAITPPTAPPPRRLTVKLTNQRHDPAFPQPPSPRLLCHPAGDIGERPPVGCAGVGFRQMSFASCTTGIYPAQ